MFFRKERADVICRDLKKYSIVQRKPLTDWQIKDGLYFFPNEAEEAAEPWRPFDSNIAQWEGLDRHYWFRTKLVVPDEFDNKPLSLTIKTQIDDLEDGRNPQFLAFINNVPVQGLDVNHRTLLIAEHAKAGDVYSIDLQAYTGILHANLMLVGEIREIDPDILKLYYDLKVPLLVMEKLENGSKQRIDLELAVEKVVNLIDLRVPFSVEFYDSIQTATQAAEELIYENLAGCDDVIATCIGHTHIDVAWWWTVAQTKEKAARSFSTVLKLMEEYPEYKFMSSQPQLYKFLKQRYPELYARLVQRVKEGRWEPEGAMWLEADCNATSGESLVRQIMHGKRFFQEEFNTDSTVLWLPDVFGYSAALPQIMQKSGVKYFMTTKISWNQFNKLPYDTFFWRGIDGSEVFSHMITTQGINQPKENYFTTYNGMLHPNSIMGGWERYQQKDINNDILISYGYGDGGGGPTSEMLEIGRRMARGISGSPKVRFETSKTYFDELFERVKDNPDTPKWVGELYFEYHRGTYTSMARNKRSNRKSEIGLQNLEFLSVLAERLGIEYPKQELLDLWENVLLNQFHDILPGSSIKEVYEVTGEEYKKIACEISRLTEERIAALTQAIAVKKGDVVLFNTLSFDRDDVVTIDGDLGGATALTDENGHKMPLQKTADGNYVAFIENIPAKGYRTYGSVAGAEEASPFVLTGNRVETPFYTITLDDRGMFTSIYDKCNQRQVLKPNEKANVLTVYEDKPMNFDNWDVDIYYKEKSWPVDDVAKFEWIENGPVRAVLLIERNYSKSFLRQKVIFYAKSRRIDFDTYVDWHEHQQLLKVSFPVDVNAVEATYDIQFGNVKRPTHYNTSWDVARFEVCGHKWADISEGGYGMSILNDCKYGHGIHDGDVTLTLIKSGIEPNPNTDNEEHWFTYSIYPHAGDWQQAGTVQQAYELNVPVLSKVAERSSSGKTAVSQLLKVLGDHVILETVKKAEDGNGVVIRLYEYKNKRGNITIQWPAGFKKVTECDLLENEQQSVAENTAEFTFEIKPFEIKTFRIQS